MLISQHEQPYEWNHQVWREHIESVLFTIGEYETEHHTLHSDEYGFYYVVTQYITFSGKKSIVDVKSFEDPQQAIDLFMKKERLPELG